LIDCKFHAVALALIGKVSRRTVISERSAWKWDLYIYKGSSSNRELKLWITGKSAGQSLYLTVSRCE
jgi:hypothetical protein